MITGLAKRLQMSRINCELSRKQVAEIIDVSESTIGLYESGNRQPSLSILMKLAKTYNVTSDYLLDIEINNNDSISLAGLTFEEKQAVQQLIKTLKHE